MFSEIWVPELQGNPGIMDVPQRYARKEGGLGGGSGAVLRAVPLGNFQVTPEVFSRDRAAEPISGTPYQTLLDPFTDTHKPQRGRPATAMHGYLKEHSQ